MFSMCIRARVGRSFPLEGPLNGKLVTPSWFRPGNLYATNVVVHRLRHTFSALRRSRHCRHWAFGAAPEIVSTLHEMRIGAARRKCILAIRVIIHRRGF